MGFLLYDITFLIVACLFVIIFLYKRKKKLKREGILYLYRTKIGIKIINYVGKKYEKTLKILSYFVIFIGYILMISMLYLLGRLVYLFFRFPEVVRAVKVPPIMPLIPYLPSIFKIDFLPPFYFTYWIIAIAIIAISHEFSHGIFARLNGIKIKSTGFGFLGPFLAAFVEPDENQMKKKPIFAQLSVLSAGSFANVVMTIIFFIILYLFLILSFVQVGAIFNDYAYSRINVANINSVGGNNIENPNADKILDLIKNKEISIDLIISLNGNSVNLTKIEARDEGYFISIENLKSQLEINEDALIVYDDLPAIQAGLKGTIIEFNDVEIKNYKSFVREIVKYSSGENITIKTKFNNTIYSYNIELAERPDNETKAYLGVSPPSTRGLGALGFIYKGLTAFKDPATVYEPKFGSDLIMFIYHLLWWIVIINISVALVNMLPVGLFDGGRVFYLTVLAITKKEKSAKKLFVTMTYIILFLFLLLMLSWFLSFR